jgi:hypothetical protein
MLQNAAQKIGGGACSSEGRARQIAARISNGVHFQNPVLPNGIESQADWDAHLASLEEALQPVGAWEKLCVYRLALSSWKLFRLVRHETAIVSAAILEPDNELKSSYDDDYVHADDVAEVLRRSELSLEQELAAMRDLSTRVNALAGSGVCDITFTSIERRQILTALIQGQAMYDDEDEEVNCEEDADQIGVTAEGAFEVAGHSEQEDIDRDATNNNKEPVPIAGETLRQEIEQIVCARGGDTTEAVGKLTLALAGEIKQRQRRLKLARTHIGICLIPDEHNVNRLALYERQLDAASRRYLNDLYRSQALRRGELVPGPLAVDVNVVGEGSNGLH